MQTKIVIVIEEMQKKNLTSVSTALLFRAAIEAEIKNKIQVALDFKGVQNINADFLEECFGKLYKDFSAEYLRTYMRVFNMKKSHFALLSMVCENAKRLYTRAPVAEKLYHYLNKPVQTPEGHGVLWQVFNARVGVVCDTGEVDSRGNRVQKIMFFDDPKDVKPVKEERLES